MKLSSVLFRLRITLRAWATLINKPQPKRVKEKGSSYTHCYFWQVVNNHKNPTSPWDHQKYVDDENELDEELE